MKDLRKPAKQAHQGSEDSLQMRCAESLKKELMRCGLPQELFVHVPSEGVRKPQYRAKLKLMGFRAGIPDVLLFLRTKEFTGLACELKKAGGSPTKEQKDVMAALDNQGWLCVVVNDFETFQAVITSYIQC